LGANVLAALEVSAVVKAPETPAAGATRTVYVPVIGSAGDMVRPEVVNDCDNTVAPSGLVNVTVAEESVTPENVRVNC
jgi:hypothetical protein